MNSPKSTVNYLIVGPKPLCCGIIAAPNRAFLINNFLSRSPQKYFFSTLFSNRKISLLLKTFVLSFFIILNLKSNAQSFTPVTANVNSAIQGYYEYLPAGYETSTKQYPLFIFIHGIGECGDGSQKGLKKVLYNGTPKLIKKGDFPTSFKVNGEEFSFIMICPQLTDNIRNPKVVNTLIDYCIKNYKIDESRIYITGLSMGGGLSEVYAGENVKYASRLAGMVSVCGNTNAYASLTQVMAKANLPTWFTQNTGDNVVDPAYSPRWVSNINESNPSPNPKALLSMFDAKGHDAWTKTYDPDWKQDGLNIYEWMLQYYRKSDGSIGITGSGSEPVKPAEPVAKISGALNLLLPSNSTTLSASGSSSSNGSISTFRWKVTSGPASIKLGDTTAPNLAISDLVAGTYAVELNVKDKMGMSAKTNADLVVGEPALATPVAEITGTLNLTLPVKSTTLSAAGSTSGNGSITSYNWKYVSGPSAYTLGTTTASTLAVSDLATGTYTFEVTVTDNKNVSSTSQANVIVNKALSPSTGNAAPVTSDCGCSVTLTPNPDGGIYASGTGLGVKPGDKVCIKAGTYSYIFLYNFNGTQSKPITLSNCGGQAIVTGDTYGVSITKSSFFKFTGTGSQDAYGFRVNATGRKMYVGVGISISTDFELDHVQVNGIASGTGIMIKTTPTCDQSTWESALIMKNLDIHDVSVSDINGEGINVGYGYNSTILNCNGKNTEVFAQKFNNVKIHNCTIFNTGWDGIQVTSIPVNCQVYDNNIQNFGTKNLPNQQTGILFGGSSSGNVYNNYITKGTGPGIQVSGEGNINIYNNVIANTGNDNAKGQDGIFIDGKPIAITSSKLTVLVANNTIVSSGRDNIRMQNTLSTAGSGNSFYNNLSIAPKSLGKYGDLNTSYLNVQTGISSNSGNNLNIATIASAYLTSPASGDYTLTSKSPAINAGKDLTASGIKYDKNYIARPQAGIFDIGAYEFGNGALAAPVANIAGTLNITLPTSGTTLNASGSTSTNGSITGYSWKYISGPATYTLGAVNTSTLAISGLGAGTYIFQVTVTDNKGMSANTQATVVVSAIGSVKPVAKITGTLSITLPVNTISLSAASSTSANGSITSYSWKFVSGPATYILGAVNTSALSITSLGAGTYVFQVTVTDNKGMTATTNASIVVSPLLLVSPVAKITGTLNIPLSTGSTTLSASASTSGNGSITGYTWKYVSGPSTYKLGAVNTSSLSISALGVGTYVFQVTVTDNKGMTANTKATIVVTSASGGGDCGCDIVLPTIADGGIYASGTSLGVKPGDKVCIKAGNYPYIFLYNFIGTKEQPITIINCGGQVITAGDNYGFGITKCSYYKFTGTGSSDFKYGFKVDGAGRDMSVGLAASAGTDFDIDHVEITNIKSGVGVNCKTNTTCDPTSWEGTIMDNVDLHDIKVSNVHGEGFYVGFASPTTTMTCDGKTITKAPQKLNNLRIHNCITENTGWDGIQVASTPVNCLVYDNFVKNFGTENMESQQAGILFGGNCNGKVYNNYIEKGTGSGIQVFGEKRVYVLNNIIVNTGIDGLNGQDGIYLAAKPVTKTSPVLSVYVANNTIIGSGRDNIRFLMNETGGVGTDNYFYNNISIAPKSYGKYDLNKSFLDVQNGITYVESNNLNLTSIDAAYFAAPSSGNFALTAKSPAVNKGKDLTPVTFDKKYVTRPQGGITDIGAYEFIGAAASRVISNLSPEIAFDEPAATLDGRKSHTSDNSAISEYKWTVVSGPSNNVALSNPNASTTKLSAAKPGVYQVELKVTNNQSLSESKMITIEIKEKETKLSLYPVPAKDKLNVTITGEAKGKLSLRVVDMQGRILFEKDNVQKDQNSLQQVIDVSKLHSGNYFITTVVNNKLLSSKFLKVD